MSGVSRYENTKLVRNINWPDLPKMSYERAKQYAQLAGKNIPTVHTLTATRSYKHFDSVEALHCE